MLISELKELWQDVEDAVIPADNILYLYLNEIDQTIYESVRAIIPSEFVSNQTYSILAGGTVMYAEIEEGGTSYTTGDVLTVSDGTTDCTLTITATAGIVTAVTITTEGTGYIAGEHDTTGGTGSDCTINTRVLARYDVPSDFSNLNFPQVTGLFDLNNDGTISTEYPITQERSQTKGYYTDKTYLYITPIPAETATLTLYYIPTKDLYTVATESLLLPDRYKKLYTDWFSWLYETREESRDPNIAQQFVEMGMNAMLSEYNVTPTILRQYNAYSLHK